MGSGYDIRIVANVTDSTTGIDQLDDRRRDPVRQPQRSRTQRHVKPSTSNTSTRPTRRSKLLRARPGGTSPTRARSGPASTCSRRRPAAPRPLRVELFTNDNCSGTALATRASHLTTDVPAHKQSAHRSVSGAEGRRRSRRVGIDRERRTTGQERDESSRPGSRRHGRQDGRLQVLDDGRPELHRPLQDDHPGVHRRQ